MKFHPQKDFIRNTLVAVPLLIGGFVASASDLWIYSGRDFTGAFARVSRSEGNLPIGSARSIRVDSGVWEACTGQNFTGDCRRLNPGEYRELGGRYGDTVLSVRDVTSAQGAVGYAPPRLQLFEGRDFRGRTANLEQSIGNIDGSYRMSAASAIVTGGTWEVCTDYNFGGRCQALPPGQYSDLGAQLNYRINSARSLEQPRPVTPPPPPPPVAPPTQTDPVLSIIGAIAAGVASSAAPAPAPRPDRDRFP